MIAPTTNRGNAAFATVASVSFVAGFEADDDGG